MEETLKMYALTKRNSNNDIDEKKVSLHQSSTSLKVEPNLSLADMAHHQPKHGKVKSPNSLNSPMTMRMKHPTNDYTIESVVGQYFDEYDNLHEIRAEVNEFNVFNVLIDGGDDEKTVLYMKSNNTKKKRKSAMKLECELISSNQTKLLDDASSAVIETLMPSEYVNDTKEKWIKCWLD